LQPLKGDKQRTCIEAENALACLFEPDGDSISVHGFERQGFQNEHVQSALDEVTRLVRHSAFLLRIKRKDILLLLIVERRTASGGSAELLCAVTSR
jgi:hypothetical protein